MSSVAASPSASHALLGDESTEEIVGYVRSASDVLRLVVFAALAVLLWALARWAEDSIAGIERDVISLFAFASPQAKRIIEGSAEVAVALITLAVFVPAFVTKRYRLLGYIVAGNVLTGTLVSVVVSSLHRPEISRIIREATNGITIDVTAIRPGVIAQVVGSFVILGPFVGPRWRKAGALIVAGLTLVQLLVATSLPTELFACLAIGATAGCIVLLVFGRPDQRPTIAAVLDALRASGLPATGLERVATDDRRSSDFFATLTDGRRVFAKVLSPEERSADLLFRTYRYVRLKNVGDEHPFSSLRRSVEHEALVGLLASNGGVRTPALRAVAAVGDESMLLVYDVINGTPLDRIAPDRVRDEFLVGFWQQVAALRRLGIAHRDLRRGNLYADPDGGPWIVDFAFSEVAAGEHALATDLAQMLVSLALAASVPRSVDTALQVLDVDTMASALPMLQPGALAAPTRAALREQRHLLTELRHVLQGRCAIAEPQYVELERFNRRRILTLATLALATYFLIPQFGNVGDIVDQVGDANWVWFVPVLAMTVMTFVGATLAVLGSVSQRLPQMPTFLAQVASSFASKLAPAGIGGMALNTRFIQKAGVDPPVAVTSVGLNFVAGVVVHVLMLVTFAVWAGRDAFGSIRLPDPTIALYGLAGVAAVTGVGYAVPWVRHQIHGRLVPVVRRAFGGIAGTMRHPTKLALLFGGSTVVTFSYLVALFFSIEAFGGSDLSFAQVGAIYLVASAVATVAPTPGGLGALEAAAIAGLVAAGLPNATAVPAVFLFRLATFWIPVLPGWLSLTYLQRADYV
ncbi:MAG: flippase-like domain-containing protein [Acidimicrobiia bacterium]